ncbi:MAG: polysaccharide deacetylase family protein [Bauldia sp.]
MRRAFFAFCLVGLGGAAQLSSSPAAAAPCTNPDALGVSRVLEVDIADAVAVGRVEFRGRLPLAKGEVVLTFDDGPRPGTTPAVLHALQAECARATFFIIGKMAADHSALLREVEAAGHTIGTHTYAHLLDIKSRPPEEGIAAIDGGIRVITEKLGHPPAPFFRFPGFIHTPEMLAHLADLHIAAFGADVVGDDWKRIGPDEVRARVMQRLHQREGGIIMLHDTKRATAAMLPDLLRDLKLGGYHLVALVPARAKPVPPGVNPNEVVGAIGAKAAQPTAKAP